MLKGYSPVEKSTLGDFLDDDDSKSSWEKEWDGMPEFNQGEIEPYAKIIVRFETAEDLKEFATLVKQHLSHKTKSMWHPKIPRGLHANKRYKDLEVE